MSNTDKLAAAIADNESRLDEYIGRTSEIAKRVPGWARHYHYLFFKSYFDAFPEAKSVLILGVYLGRDITFMLDALKGREIQVVGVDKFNSQPCADWPEEKLGKTWEEAFNCAPPNAKTALDNINPQEPHKVRLIEADDAVWLERVQGAFDLIFIDTAHDKATVQRQIRQVHKLCHPFTIVAGDDYANLEKTWGVKDAVAEGFKRHQVLANTIWFSGAEDFL